MTDNLGQMLHLLNQADEEPLSKTLSVRVSQTDSALILAVSQQIYTSDPDLSTVVRRAFREGIESIIRRHLAQKELPFEAKPQAFPNGRWL